MTISTYWNDPKGDLPLCENEPFLAKQNDIITFRGFLWKVNYCFRHHETPQIYTNKHKACYCLVRSDMGIIETNAYITNDDFGDAIEQASVYEPNEFEKNIIERSKAITYTDSYRKLIGKSK